MIEEQGRVVAIERGAVWVEAQSKTSCSGCAASIGCDRGLLLEGLRTGGHRRRIRALSAMPLQVGDPVVIGIRKDLLLRSALAVYLLPLLGLFIFAISAQWFGFREPLVIFAGFLGFASVWIVVRSVSRRQINNPALQPVVLRTLLGVPQGYAGRAAF
ncbi:SoxR reducing system RseC family protein [Azotobacter armeniacus]